MIISAHRNRAGEAHQVETDEINPNITTRKETKCVCVILCVPIINYSMFFVDVSYGYTKLIEFQGN